MVKQQGYEIIYHLDWKAGEGNVSNTTKKIRIGCRGMLDEINLTIIHELIHIPFDRHCPMHYKQEYEDAIDEVAKPYVSDREFMNYLRKTIPYSVSL